LLSQLECPAAAARVPLLVGAALEELEARIQSEMAGVQGCTHLTDLLRTLIWVPRVRSCDRSARNPD